MTGTLTIRPGTDADAGLLADLGADTFLAAYEAQVGAAILRPFVADAFTPERLADELADPDGTFLIAEVDGTVAGYARLTAGSPPDEVVGRHPIELSRLYLVPGFIGQGIGAALMRQALDQAADRDGDVLWLGVWSLNERAIAFYRRWRFEVVAARAFELGQVTHQDLVMVRSVRGPIGSADPAVRHGVTAPGGDTMAARAADGRPHEGAEP